MPRVVYFELNAKNPKRAAKFYQDSFGWNVEKWKNKSKEYWLLMTGNPEKEMGIDGGMTRMDVVDQPVVNTIAVKNLDDTLEKVEKAGGKILPPGKYEIPGVAWVAYFLDTEGNKFGIIETDEYLKDKEKEKNGSD